jgi:hypothetical protein
MQQIDLTEEAHYFKALIYGKPGTGKTSFGCTAPKPLILLSERQGVVHIKAAAKRLKLTTPPQVMFMESIEDYRHVGNALTMATKDPTLRNGPFIVKDAGGKVIYQHIEWPQTVVFDSFTDACKLIEDDINRISPPRIGKDGLPVPSERYWSALKDRIEKLIRFYRDVDFHLLFLCLEDDRTVGEGDEAHRVCGPQVPMRALPGALAASVNVVGIMERVILTAQGDAAKIGFGVRTIGPGYCLLKPFRPLEDLEKPNFSAWLAKIAGTQSLDIGEALKEEIAKDDFFESNARQSNEEPKTEENEEPKTEEKETNE